MKINDQSMKSQWNLMIIKENPWTSQQSNNKLMKTHQDLWKINENQWVVARGGRSCHGRLPSPPAPSVTGVRYDNKKTVPRFSSIVLGNCNRMRQGRFLTKNTVFSQSWSAREFDQFQKVAFPSAGQLLWLVRCSGGPILTKNSVFSQKRSCSARTGLGRSPTVFRFYGLPQSLDFQ